jgi:hypothetical protein
VRRHQRRLSVRGGCALLHTHTLHHLTAQPSGAHVTMCREITDEGLQAVSNVPALSPPSRMSGHELGRERRGAPTSF